MYRPGHYGAALLVWAPLGGLLTVVGLPEIALLGVFIMLAFEQLPDFDMRTPLMKHRGFSHTFIFALLIGGVVGAIGIGLPLVYDIEAVFQYLPLSQSGQRLSAVLGLTGFVFGTLGIISHLAADVITPSGIPVMWPYSSKRYSYDLVYAKDMAANYILLGLGILVASPVIVYAL
jgi:inner membrane protein